MKAPKQFSINENWLVMVGLVLVVWGLIGAAGVFESGGLQNIFSGGAQAAGEGFVPYSVPLDEESLAILEEAAKLEGGSGLAPMIEQADIRLSGEEDSRVTPMPSPTPPPPTDPSRLVIPKIELVAPVIEAKSRKT